MCGIAGVIGKEKININLKDTFFDVLKRIKHRGYKNNEVGFLDDLCILGANRLEIVDKERGIQPFISKDNNTMVVFNGEIYDYKLLRKELEQKNFIFNTNCDTEVILNGYIFGGIKWLKENLKGMFACIIYDKKNSKLIAMRDHFGIKPLYWTTKKNFVFFSSEIKGLIDVNNQINELGAGELLQWNSENQLIEIEKYFSPYQINYPNNISFDESKNKIKNLLSNAVKKRVDTDLPVAVLLGGIDSGIVLYLAKKFNKNVTAFTIGRDDNVEDMQFAIKLCKELNVKLEKIYTNEEELLSLIPEVIRTIESFEPNHIRGGTLSYLISKKIKENGFRIALCGEGADELFGGYPEYYDYFVTNGYQSLNKLRLTFVSELHKTQLKRVDRTSMSQTLEVRVPYLDVDLASYVLSLSIQYMIKEKFNIFWGKHILREAFREELPDYVIDQKKRVLSDGAGFGTNDEEGPFYDYTLKNITDAEYSNLKNKFANVKIKNKEEAFYLKIFSDYYSLAKVSFLEERPLVNKIK